MDVGLFGHCEDAPWSVQTLTERPCSGSPKSAKALLRWHLKPGMCKRSAQVDADSYNSKRCQVLCGLSNKE